ncbi:MAG: phospholipase D family protein, partial [Rhodococcus sp.]|nr:phospholipase D family protein [Rhodococcus sp. (in: high G+C Gram-positive bacteria)]
MGLECTDSLAVLDALTPEPGWETDLALFSSYSVDLVAVAAVVVALADEGDDHERLRDAPLARACERMRDRFRVVCQAGRVAVPKSGTSALVIADRWIREVRHDGNERSWHAKLALVRYRPTEAPDGEAEWRLWIGSRNLTRDTSWDSALTAVGRNSETSDSIDQSVAHAGRVLAARADLPGWSAADAEDELLGLHWEWPEDMEVVSFDMWPDAQSAPRFPKAPSGLDHVVAVSPFVNSSIARKLSNWGRRAANRQLLTTPETLAALADRKRRSQLEHFTSLHQLDMSPGADDADTDHQDDTGDDQMVEVHRGLHTKLLWARSTAGDELWLGSANLTERAWNGRNTEGMVHARVLPNVGEGLIGCLVNGLSTEVRQDDLVTARPGEDPAEKALDKLRNRIAALWDARLEQDDASDTVRCETDSAPLHNHDAASLSVRLLGQTDWVQWKPRETAVEFAATELH